MIKRLLNLALLLTLPSAVFAQPVPDYHVRYAFLATSPATFEDGLLGFVNPANLAFLHKPELRFAWSTKGTKALSIGNWGLFSGMKHLGLAVQRQKFSEIGVTDFRVGTGWGSRVVALGLAYGWSAGKFNALGRAKLATVGAIARPSPFLSLGLIGNFSLESSDREGVAELGIRPFGTPAMALFVDAAVQNGVKLKDAFWSAGASLRLISGVHLVGRYFRSDAFTFGINFNLGRSGVAAQGHFDSSQDHAFTTYTIRSGGAKPSFLASLGGNGQRYVPMNLKGRVDYLTYRVLDGGKNRLFDVLTDVEAAVEDPRVRTIALNLSSMSARPEHAWEIREALKEARAAGKSVVVFVDRAGMTTYHLASVADRIVMDPQGSFVLQGYSLGRTYLKGTLEKLGLGFDEWRFFKYKSANETFSRDAMSAADREQLQDYVDDWYELTRAEVCSSRNISVAEFDQLVDEVGFIPPERALQAGLVDTLARWSGMDGVLTALNGHSLRGLPASRLRSNALSPENWGRTPKIALVYGLGVCAMDEGIRARWLERVFLSLANSRSVKAVVFRVDSPGGDGMASDLVAEALEKCSESKPVIVSQGQVAGSGGYWISMYGDTIVAGPNTITGSIGVIGGWVYDKGFGDKLGMTSDLVQRGKHADLGRGISLPLLNLEIPARNLTAEERAIAEKNIKLFYDVFVNKVAEGRNMPEGEVRQIAEGHIYSGIRGKEIGLVDEIGGLMAAMAIARQQAGLEKDAEFEIIEIPENKGFVDLQQQISPLATQQADDSVIRLLRIFTESGGRPLPILLPGTYPVFEKD